MSGNVIVMLIVSMLPLLLTIRYLMAFGNYPMVPDRLVFFVILALALTMSGDTQLQSYTLNISTELLGAAVVYVLLRYTRRFYWFAAIALLILPFMVSDTAGLLHELLQNLNAEIVGATIVFALLDSLEINPLRATAAAD